MSNVPVALLSFIRGAETSRGYEDYSRFARIPPPKPITEMTVNEVRAWQRENRRVGSQSTAIGGYQIISKTFDRLVKQMGLTGDEVFNTELQDTMAVSLLEGRGFSRWQSGKLSDEQFMNNLAKEWAALPTSSGRGYYDGDGLNKAGRSPAQVLEALAATRSGEAVDLSGLPVGVGDPSQPRWQPPSEADQERALRIANIDPNTSVNGTDMQQVGATPPRTFRSTSDDRRFEREAEANRPGFLDSAALAIDEQWISSSVARQLGRAGFEEDPNFQYSEKLWSEVSEGLPDEYLSNFDAAVSEDHARVLADQTRRQYETSQKLDSLGWGGVGMRLSAALLDPVAAAASVATLGTASPFIYAEKAGRVGRALRAGTAAGAVNAGIEGYLTSQTPTQNWENVAYAALAGMALGGLGGAFGRTAEDAALAREAARLRKTEPPPSGNPVPRDNSGSSVGAAQVNPLSPDATVAERAFDAASDTPMTAFGQARFSLVGNLKSNDNPIIRKIADVLAEDGVGNANNAVNIRGASENVAREMRVRMARFYRDYDDAFAAWSKETGNSRLWRNLWDPAVRVQFNREVGQAVRRELDGPFNTHVAKVAARIKREQADLLEYAKDKGLRGFDDVKENSNYLRRQYNIERLDEIVDAQGLGSVHRLFAESMMSANKKRGNRARANAKPHTDLDYEDALTMSKAFVKSIRSRRFGSFHVNRAMLGEDLDTLKMMLQDADLDTASIDRIVSKMANVAGDADKGRISQAKFRMDLDETYSLSRGDGQPGLSIEDVLENDAELLFSSYARQVIGSAEIEEAFASFKLPNPDGTMAAQAPSYETVKRYAQETFKGSKAQWDRAEAQLDTLYKAVAGIPQENITGTREALRLLRDYNFSRVGGQLGIAQLAEIGNIIGQGGVRALMQHIPALRRIFTMAKGGQFSDDLFNEIEAIWGFGTDYVRASPHVRMDSIFGTTFEGRNFQSTAMQKADAGLQRAKMVTGVASGMTHVNMALQRFTGRVVVQRFLDDAVGARSINVSRLRAMGVSDELHPRIQAQMKKYVDTSDGLLGRKVSRINLDKWDDLDAKNAFINGVDRWSKKIIQENDVGNMPGFMTREMGKTIFQFRSFMLASYEKQLLTGVHHRDWETFSAFMTSMFFGGLFYAGQTVVNAQGRSDKEELLQERLSPTNIAKASFQRAGFSSVIPVAVDVGGGMMGFGPVFDFRTSDLSSQLLGNPSIDLVQNLQRSLQSIVAPMVNSDYQFSQQDMRALTKTLLFQNAFIVRNGLAMLGNDLPRYSQ